MGQGMQGTGVVASTGDTKHALRGGLHFHSSNTHALGVISLSAAASRMAASMCCTGPAASHRLFQPKSRAGSRLPGRAAD